MMRNLKVANISNQWKCQKIQKEYKFLEKLASQIASSEKEFLLLYNLGLNEYKSLIKSNPKIIINGNHVWHLRQFMLDNLILTKGNIRKLKNINGLLKVQETRIRNLSQKLILSLDKQVSNKTIDDYDFETSFSVFSEDQKCNEKHKVTIDDPFYTDNTYFMFTKGLDEAFYINNWNENTNRKLNFGFCYTMHSLMYHSNLELQDILTISDVWIELKVNYQFLIKTK